MAWDANWVLEGLFTFGEPLNLWQIELYDESRGSGQLTYYQVNFNLDDDPYIIERLDQMIREPIVRYPRLIVLENQLKAYSRQGPWIEYRFHDVWLNSLETNFRPSRYPYTAWSGWTLGIAFRKTPANKAAVDHFFHIYKKLGLGDRKPARA